MMIGIFLLAMGKYEYPAHSEILDHIWEGICVIVSLFGLGIRVFTIGYTPKGTSGRNTSRQIADSLNTTGMYSIVRNPLYLGNFFMWLGLASFSYLWWVVLLYISVFVLYYERIVFAEEAYLSKKFGDQYLEWANVTSVFIPRFSRYKKADMAFSLKNVLKREYNGFFVVVLFGFIMELVGELFSETAFDMDFGWIVLLCISFVIWVVLRSLKRYTTILDVEGR